MRRAILVALGTGAVITSAAAIGIGATLGPPAQPMSLAEFTAASQRITEQHERASARCEPMPAVDAEVCRAQQRGQERVSRARLEVQFRHSENAERAAQRALIDARYEVARARCEALKGFRRESCLVQAHAARGRALMEATAPYYSDRLGI